MLTHTAALPSQLTASIQIAAQVAAALIEDIGSKDLTAELILPEQRASAQVISRETAILCGQPWFEECFRQVAPTAKITWHALEGALVEPNQTLCHIEGPARGLLTAERMALNFLQTLSGTATIVHRYVQAIAGSKATIVDTRKTLPGLRMAQKYAVKIGGGENHRLGLFDGILIKENHIAAAGGLTQAFQAAQALVTPGQLLEVEVENLDQLAEALSVGASLILLDNFDLSTIRQAVAYTAGRARLEVSGNVTLEKVRQIAATGVDRISIGSLTKHVQAIDLSMRFQPTTPVLPNSI